MSNICFNLSQGFQPRTISLYDMKTMREAQEEWDAAGKEVRELQRLLVEKMLKTRKTRARKNERRTRQKSL